MPAGLLVIVLTILSVALLTPLMFFTVPGLGFVVVAGACIWLGSARWTARD